MIYKTYRAPTYKEAVLNAKMELGNSIYILGRKEIKEGGFLGLFSKTFTEITVAKNEDVAQTSSKKVKEQAPQIVTKPLSVQKELEHQSDLVKELSEIKARLEEIALGGKKDNNETPFIKKLVRTLENNDFSPDFIGNLKKRIMGELTLQELENPETLEKKLKGYIGESIQTSGPIQPGKGKPRVVVLVGPTGVGKTTTIAKLAASYGVLQQHKVELFTIDAYRIAAIEQLGKYAELMQLPFIVINSREEFKNAVMNSKSELIFVDTAGRSQKNNLGLAELRNILDGVQNNLEVHLVVSATTKYRDAIDVMTRFNQLMYDRVIISKLDETNSVGPVLSVLNREKKLSYLTTGQSVPDDIELAEKEKLLSMLDFECIYGG